ncbi:MAG: CotH kinase family protein, partial [Clostridia bacterium]|nr:CotH kinase family protein [Clostridia bacterium]
MNDLKKRMRHLWPLLLALVLTVTLFVACTGDTQDPSDSSASSDATSSAVSDSETADSSDSSGLPADSNAATEETQGEQTPSDSKDPDGSVSEDPSDSAEVSEETSVEEPTEEPTDPPVITVPSEDAPDEPAGTDSVPEETLPYDPDLHPGDASKYAGVLIHSVYGTGKKGAEALISNGYVQLYNKTDKNISLKGASLYYKSDGSNPFDQFVFPDDAVIPAGGYYLVRANAPSDFNAANAVMKVEYCDAEWNVYIDNKEIRLLLAPSGWSIARDEDITTFDDAISTFVATMEYHSSVYALYDLSRNKVAVRTAMEEYSGYHTVNLTRSATPELRDLRTRTSSGIINEVVKSKLNEVMFSYDAGIYDKTLLLSLSAESGYTVYYTTDGTDPSVETNRSRKKYSTAIMLGDTSAMGWGPLTRSWSTPTVSTQVGAHVIKAYATNGTESTAVFTNTYFITDDLEQYGVTIMSFSMPREEVVGTEGFYNNFLLTGSITGDRRRGVAIMEVFDPSGDRVGNSRVEMAVSGNGSSGWGMKSLRIYLKGALNQDAGLESNLNYDIFGGEAKDQWGQAITSFSRFMIRNSGNDCGTSYIRDAFMQTSAAGLNVSYMESASTLVFINGEFWGVYNFRERYSPEYVESHYGVNKDNVTVIESDYSQVHTNTNADFVLSSGVEGDQDPFNEMVQYMRDHNLANQEYYDHVASLMDVDSFIDMWVVRLFYVARDWPENNIKVWRNKNPDDPSGMDTKWHFTLLDLDMGLSFYDFTTERENFFWAFDSGSVCGTMMRALMKNEGFKQQFMTRYYEVVRDHFTPEQLSAAFEEMYAERDPLMALQAGRWNEAGFTVSKWQTESSKIRSFVNNRQAIALSQFYSYFGTSEAEMETLSQKRITITYQPTRADVTLNGETAQNGMVIKLEKGETKTIHVKAVAKEGFIVTGISYTDSNGNVQSVEGTEVIIMAGEGGTISVYTKRANTDTDSLKNTTIVAGATYMFYLTGEGDLYAWGDNRYGVLGLPASQTIVKSPTFVMSGVAKVVTTDANAYENGEAVFTTAIILKDGRVLTVGSNTCGQLGRNGTSDDYTLGEIDFDRAVVDVSLGSDHMLIVDADGNLWGIG